MKTAEDEAFEDLERRQGGGFKAKQAMAADKLQEPVERLDCGSNNVGILATYDSLVDSVKSQPAQEPVAWRWVPSKVWGNEDFKERGYREWSGWTIT